MRKYFYILAAILLTMEVQAQKIDWFVQKHELSNEQFHSSSVYIPSGVAGDYIVSFYTTTIPATIPQQPSFSMHYVVAYDTSGSELWRHEVTGNRTLVPTKENYFWLIISGLDSINLANQKLTNDGVHNYPQFRTHYYIKMDRNGNIVRYFTKEMILNNDWNAKDLVIDDNDNFLMGGSVSPNGSGLLPFNFGNYYDTLRIGTDRLAFVARMDSTGKELDFYPLKAQFSTVVHSLDYSTETGEILFTSGLRDTIRTPDTMLISQSVSRVVVGIIDANFNLKQISTHRLGTFGGYFYNVRFNAIDQNIYAIGGWGDTCFIDPDSTFIGHPNTTGNALIAKFDKNLTLLNYRTFSPITKSVYSRFMAIGFSNNQSIDRHGNFHFSGHFKDSAFVSQDTILRYYTNPNPQPWNIKSFYMSLDTNLSIRYDLIPDDDKGNGTFPCLITNPNGNQTYLLGSFSGDYQLKNINIQSTTTRFDALMLKITDTSLDSLSDTTNLSIQKRTENSEISIYPNPIIDNEFFINSKKTIQSINLFDINGRLLSSNFELIESNSSKRIYRVLLFEVNSGVNLARIRLSENTVESKLLLFK